MSLSRAIYEAIRDNPNDVLISTRSYYTTIRFPANEGVWMELSYFSWSLEGLDLESVEKPGEAYPSREKAGRIGLYYSFLIKRLVKNKAKAQEESRQKALAYDAQQARDLISIRLQKYRSKK